MAPPRPPPPRPRPSLGARVALVAGLSLLAASPAAADFDAAKKSFQDGLAQTDWKTRRAGYQALLDYDGGPAAQAVLAALGAETNAAVEAAAVDGLGRMRSKEATAELLSSLAKGKSKERLLAAVALTRHVTPEVDAALIAALAGKDAILAAQAALALGASGRSGASPALVAALSHAAPQVRIAAMRSLAATADKAGGPAIVARLATETGRVRGEAIRALETLAVKKMGDAPKKWAAWAKGDDPDAVDEKPTLPPSFFGAPVTGTRVVFCLDRSLLMKDAHPWVGAEGRERLEALCNPPDGERIPWRQLKTKLQISVAQILHAVDGLPTGAKVEVITFAKEVGGAFDKKLVQANGANRKALAVAMHAVDVDDGINLFDALATALDLGGPTEEKAWKAGPDEIFLVTNNGPTAGLVADVDAVGPAIALRARLRMVPITVVGIGNHPYGLAETLAKRTGGLYLNLSK